MWEGGKEEGLSTLTGCKKMSWEPKLYSAARIDALFAVNAT
jgi:hypothetical protein